MADGRITKRAIDALASTERDFVKWDGELKGFGVRVRPTGAKSFIAFYRTGGRNSPVRKVTIGTVGKMDVEKAREAARKILAGAELGQDHAAEKAKARAEKTVNELCDLYVAEGCETKKPSTMNVDRGRIARHIKPLLGKKRVGEVQRDDIERFMRDVASGKTATDVKTVKRGRAIVEGGKGTATRTVGLLGGIFSFAVARKLRSDNPVRGVKRYPDQKRETFLSNQQFATLGAALSAAETDGANASAVAIIRLLAFTGARKSEIAKLKWDEVDMERGYLGLNDTKTGQKAKQVGAPVVEILSRVSKIQGSDFVFPATTGSNAFQGADKIWRKVRAAAGFPKLRIHDLRHSFASAGLARGDTLPLIGAILGHKDVKTTSRYAHLAAEPIKMAADNISRTVQAAFNGNASAEIVPLRPRGTQAG